MSYKEDPKEDERIRQRIREIMNEKISDRRYKGQAINSHKELSQVRKDRAYRKKKDSMREYKPYAMGYGHKYCEMCGSAFVGGAKEKKKYGVSSRRVRAGVRSAKKNEWLDFYKDWIRRNKNKKFKGDGRNRIKIAGEDYQIWKSKQ